MALAPGRCHLAAALGLLLISGSGCSLSVPLAQQAIDYNTSIETAANTVLLRNVLRARDNAPLHFTSIPQVRGSLNVGLTQPGLLFPVSGDRGPGLDAAGGHRLAHAAADLAPERDLSR